MIENQKIRPAQVIGPLGEPLTLDNLPRVQLASLCRFVGIQPFGTDAFLAARLRSHLARIKADDRAIKEEGLDSLTDEEMRSACRARGMRAPFGEGARAASNGRPPLHRRPAATSAAPRPPR